MKKQLVSLALASIVCAGIAEARGYIGIEGGYTGGAIDSKSANHASNLNTPNSSYYLTPGGDTYKNTFEDKTYSYNGGNYEVEPWKGFNIALTLGTENFFLGNFLGTRWGASVGFTEIMQDWTDKSNSGSISYTDTKAYIDAGLSFDLMLNIITANSFTFGLFGGVETAYHYLVINDREDSKTDKTADRLNAVDSRHSMEFLGRVGLSTLIARHHRFDVTVKLPFGYVAAGEDNKVKISGSEPLKTSFNVGYKYVF